MNPRMTCAEAEPLLPLVADGAVDPAADPDLFDHLASCPACQRLVAEHDLITLALERGSVRRPRARILTLPHLAAAAALLLVLGATAWAMLARSHQVAPVAPALAAEPSSAPPPTSATAPASATAPLTPAVLRVQRTDGSTFFLVRRDDTWVAVDPGLFDGSESSTPANAADVPVRW